MQNFERIPHFKFWCQKVLPLVYDDSLSYYELLCKVVEYLNHVINDINNIPNYINELISDEKLREIMTELLSELRVQIAPVDEGTNTTASADRVAGQWVWLDGKIYRITRNILAGERYVLSSEGVTGNIEKITIEYMIDILFAKLGDLSSLTTEEKDNLVSALNEVYNVVSSNYEKFSNEIGDITTLASEDKSSLVKAINECLRDIAYNYDLLINRTSENNTLIVNLLNALSDNGIILNNYNTIHVDTLAHDDFVNLRDAIISANTSNIPTIIVLENGTYDMPTLFPTNLYPSGCVVPDNTYLVGKNREKCVLTTSFNDVDNVYSTVNLSYTSGLFNMTIEGTKCRYCVHDDNSTDGAFTRIIKNVKFVGSNLGLRWAYGAGIRNGETLKLIDCEFYNNNGCFSIHNWVGEERDTHIELTNCMFTQYAYGDNPYDIILTSMYSHDEVTTHGNVIVDINGCNANCIAFTSDSNTTNYFYVNCDNENTFLSFYYYPERINKPNYKRISNTSGITGKGQLVALTNFGTGARIFETNYSKSFANGITISDELSDGSYIIVTGGCIQPMDIDLTITPGQFLTYDRVNTELIASTEDPTDMWLGYMHASNALKLNLN